jgi:hypothetical protein
MTKKCCKCQAEKDISEYHKCKSNKDGLQKRCKTCNKHGMLNSYHNNPDVKAAVQARATALIDKMRHFIDSTKSEYGCFLCPEKDGCCLDFHHFDANSKNATIAHLVTAKSKKRLLSEIKKCVIICSNCHRKVHAGKLEVKVLPVYDKFDMLL